MITNEHIEQYLAQAHRYGDAKLMLCSSGNLSWRIGEEALVSGTGSWVPNLQKEKVSVCNISTGIPQNGVKPSMESTFHLGILRERPEHNSVLLTNHGQVVCGKDFDQVYERATFFEMACRIIVQSGGDYSVLTPEEIDDLEIYVLGKKTK